MRVNRRAKMEWMLLPLKRYAQFSGRSRRKEYWMFVLLAFIIYAVAMFLDSALGLGGSTTNYADVGDGGAAVGFNSTGGILTLIVALALFDIPSLSPSPSAGCMKYRSFGLVAADRPRAADRRDRAAGFLLHHFDGTKGPNRFGPDPKGDTPAELAEKFS